MHKATTFEHGGKVYEVRAIPTLNGWKVRIFVEGIPANGFTYSVDSEAYQDAAIDRVPEDLVAGLMETAERDFRRGFAQESVVAEKANDDDIAAEKYLSVCTVAIPDQVARDLLPAASLSELIGDPFGGWIRGHSKP